MKRFLALLVALLLAQSSAWAAPTTKLKNNFRVTGNLTVDGTTTQTGALSLGTVTVGTSITIPNTGLKLLDTGGDHAITIAPSSNEAANRTVSLPALGGAQTLAILGAQTFSGVQTFSAQPVFSVPLVKSNVNASVKRYVLSAIVSPPTGAAVDATTYRALLLPGRACTVTRVSVVAQVPPADGTNAIKVLKAASNGNTMLSAATFDANTLVANAVQQPALTATGADLALTAAQGIYVEYTGAQTTTDAQNVCVSVEVEADDI